jgi:hypothetical protein
MNTTETILEQVKSNLVAAKAIEICLAENATISIIDNGTTSMMLEITESGQNVPIVQEPVNDIAEIAAVFISRLNFVF